MNQVDKISKALFNLVEYSKDLVKSNLTTGNAKEKDELKLTEAQLVNVLKIVEASIAQGYERGFKTFQKSVSQILTEPKDNSKPTSESRKKR